MAGFVLLVDLPAEGQSLQDVFYEFEKAFMGELEFPEEHIVVIIQNLAVQFLR